MTSTATTPVVIESVPATFTSTLPTAPGRTFTNSKVLRQTFSDGTVVFRCAECGFTRDSYYKVLPHLGSHSERKPRAKVAVVPTPAERASALLTELIGVVAELAAEAGEKASASDRDEWRARALDAEKRLRSLRRALGVSTPAA